jgi:hypothetical protein
MRHSENDIDFKKISGEQFEELCFDLLSANGYQNLEWRQGGSDSGRDIEAILIITNELIGAYPEKWFIECKNLTNGVTVTDLDSKIAWARAEKPRHFLLITGSYVTNPTRDWLNKIRQDVSFIVDVIEGKTLKGILLRFPNLIEKFFLGGVEKLLQDSIQLWLNHGTLPGPEILFEFYKKIDPKKLTDAELCFLLYSYLACDKLASWIINNTVFSYEHFVIYLTSQPRSNEGLLEGLDNLMDSNEVKYDHMHDWHLTYTSFLFAELNLKQYDSVVAAIYTCIQDDQGAGLEFLLTREEKMSCDIRCILPSTKKPEMKEDLLLLLSRLIQAQERSGEH